MARDIEQGIFALLSNNEDVKHWSAGRVYVGNAPQGVAVPYVVYRRSASRHVQSAAGFASLAVATISIQGWAATYDDAKQLVRAIRLAMVNGAPDTIGGVYIHTILMGSDSDTQEQVVQGEETGEFAVETDYEVWYSEDAT